MARILYIILLLGLLHKAQAQNISGYVIDSLSGEILIGAHITTTNNHTIAVSNAYGYFSIKTSDTDTIKISYVGYSSLIFPTNEARINVEYFKLSPNNSIEEINVLAQQSIQERTEMGIVSIPVKLIKELPALGGEPDIMKALQLMPGIRSSGEGQSAYFVRGGSADQNLIIFDNVPVYYINHLGGFVSVFNTDAINHIKMHKGAYPAKYGGRLSSVTAIQSKDGHCSQHSQKLTLGIISSKLHLEGPIKKDTLTYSISGRRMLFDLLSRTFTHFTENGKQFGYTFYDLNAKVNYKLSPKDRFYLSFYTGNDKMLSRQKDKVEKTSMNNTSQWGNLISSLRWNRSYTNSLFSNVTAYYSQYFYRSNFEYRFKDEDDEFINSSDFQSAINDLSINSSFEYTGVNWLKADFGTNSIYHTYKPNHYEHLDAGSKSITPMAETSTAFENAAYCDFLFKPFSFFSFSTGYRFVAFSLINKTWSSHEPRLFLNLNIPELASIKASYSEMTQFVHRLSYFGAAIPADLWVPSTNKVAPQSSKQWSLGVFKNFKAWNTELSIEAYYKKLNQLIEFKQGYNLFQTDDWTNAIEDNGQGHAKGIELLIHKKAGEFSGWLSYTLSESKRQFDNINRGKPYYYTYDARHDISLAGSYNLKENLVISASWTYQSGRAITLANYYYSTPFFDFNYENDVRTPPILQTRNISSYDEKNSVRMAPYHRLDASITYKKKKKRSNRELTLSIYNLYNRQNPLYYFVGLKESTNKAGEPILEKAVYQRSMFPIIPSISYSWQW